MDDQNDRPEYSREPTIEDLVELCRRLNEAGVKYVLVGGFAVILNGFIGFLTLRGISSDCAHAR